MREKFLGLKPTDLRCEYKINPLGIDELNPKFSWITLSENINSFQSAFRLLIASSESNIISLRGDIWDSGKVQSDISINIKYSGDPLSSNTLYFWRVMIWDENNQSSQWSETAFFSTGLLSKNEWKAKWISHVYKEEKSNELSFIAGNDKWIWYPLKNQDEIFKDVVLVKKFYVENIKELTSSNLIVTCDEKFKLWINKKLVAQSDNKIFSWARPVTENVIDFLFDGFNELYVEASNSYVEKPGFLLRLELKFKSGETAYVVTDESWVASVLNNDNSLMPARTVAIVGDLPWRIPKVNLFFNPAAYFRKKFLITKKVKRAFVYCSALGLYNIKIDGKPITSNRLTPGWSDFNLRANYNTYDITSLLNSSNEHIINLILADGYYSGYCGWEKGRGYYGKYPALIFQLMILYDDDSEEIICSDQSWTSSEGPIREADILMGEFYNSEYENFIKDWDSCNNKLSSFRNVEIRNDLAPRLTSYKSEEVKIREEIKPASIRKTNNKKFIIDFGQNFAGFVRLTLLNEEKTKIFLRFAEVLNPDGTLYLDNLRMARATDSYVSKGGIEEIWEPLFTYHGFRYVEVSGIEKINSDTIRGIVINSLPQQVGHFNSSNEKINKLFHCILWNQRSNYLDIPTDCPQRDERFGWTGDAVSYFQTASSISDVSSFYQKWFEDLFETQKYDGALPPFAPIPPMGVGPVFYNAAGWADAGIISLYNYYRVYDDIGMLEKYYDKMKLFIRSLEKTSDNFILPDYGYGDWLSWNAETPKSLIGTAYFAYDCFLMNEIAGILGETEDKTFYTRLFQNIRKSFRNYFINSEGELVTKTQTGAVLSIFFNLLEPVEKEKAASFLISDIIEKKFHTTCGFLGLSFLTQVLRSLNRNDIIWKLITNEEYPSWFFMIENGATTLWERWDSFHPQKGFFDPTMNSFNHCSLGSIGEWFFTGIAGIDAIEPGYKKFIIKQFIPDDMSFAKASLKTNYGIIKSEWEKRRSKVLMKIDVPFNSSAIIIIPSEAYNLPTAHNLLRYENGFLYIEVGSGCYEIDYEIK